MVVSVSGFGWSGSGAVLDFLKEYSDLEVAFNNCNVDPEFILLSDVDGIRDLEYHLIERNSRISSYVAIQRFLKLASSYNKFMNVDRVFKGKFMEITQSYINKLVDFEFEGATYHEYFQTKPIFIIYNKYMPRILGNRISRIFFGDLYKKVFYEKTTKMAVSYKPDCFLQATRDYLDSLFSMLRHNKNIPIVFDQMLPPDNPMFYMKYFEEPKCIAVRRDPRDTYLLAKCAYNSRIPIPTNNVDDFILFYRKIIQDTKMESNQYVLNVQFEDMIYKYNETKFSIEQFLGISNHTKPKSFFKPDVSVNNTQLYRRYKGNEKDVLKIEKELSDSLYPFELFNADINTNSIVF